MKQKFIIFINKTLLIFIPLFSTLSIVKNLWPENWTRSNKNYLLVFIFSSTLFLISSLWFVLTSDKIIVMNKIFDIFFQPIRFFGKYPVNSIMQGGLMYCNNFDTIILTSILVIPVYCFMAEEGYGGTNDASTGRNPNVRPRRIATPKELLTLARDRLTRYEARLDVLNREILQIERTFGFVPQSYRSMVELDLSVLRRKKLIMENRRDFITGFIARNFPTA